MMWRCRITPILAATTTIRWSHSRSRTQGWLLGDTLGFFNDKVLFTAAARHQKVVVRNYSNATGLEDTSSRYTQSRWMPTFGLVYKPWSSCRCMLTIPKRCSRACGADDGGQCRAEVPGSAHSKQDEVGVKIDYGTIGGSLALFEIKKPNAISDHRWQLRPRRRAA